MQEHHRPELYTRIVGLSLNDNHLLTCRKTVETMRSLYIVSFLSRSKHLNFPAEERRIVAGKKSWRFDVGGNLLRDFN